MPPRPDLSYDDSHRAFLQAFMARGTLTYDEAKPLLAAILTAHEGREVAADTITPSIFSEYISAVGNAVSDFDYEVRSSLPQKARTARSGQEHASVDIDDGGDASDGAGNASERVYALINATSDDLTQLATTFSADELAFVKRVLDEMFDHSNVVRQELCGLHGSKALQLHAPKDRNGREAARQRASAQGNMTLTQGFDGDDSQTQATQGGSRAQAITMTQAQGVLDNLVLQGWFERSRKGFYSLTPRALMELRTWLMDTYNDEDEEMADEDGDEGVGQRIKLCRACKEIVTIGQRCPKLTCPVRLHDGCTQRFFRMHKSESCPVCKSSWKDHRFVGERAAEQGPKKKSKGSRVSQVAVRSSGGHDGADDDDDDDEDMQQTAS